MSGLSIIAKTMSSVEIAELTGKQHKNVIRDIKRMLEDLDLDGLRFELIYKDKYGRDKPAYQLPERECLILVSGYNIKMRAAIVDRWKELEEAGNQLPQSFSEALRLAADLSDKNAEQKKRLEQQAPDIEAFERIAKANGSTCISIAAKELQLKPSVLTRWLSTNRWIFKRAGTSYWVAYQGKIESGYVEHKTTYIEKYEKTTTQVRITPKGLARISRLMSN